MLLGLVVTPCPFQRHQPGVDYLCTSHFISPHNLWRINLALILIQMTTSVNRVLTIDQGAKLIFTYSLIEFCTPIRKIWLSSLLQREKLILRDIKLLSWESQLRMRELLDIIENILLSVFIRLFHLLPLPTLCMSKSQRYLTYAIFPQESQFFHV